MARVLIVDDSPTARLMTMSRLPPRADLEVAQAEGGEEAIELYQEKRPDLVILDLTMPGMDGFELIGKLIALDPSANVVVLTADLQLESRRRCLAAGAKAVFNKPVQTEDLLRVLPHA
jgi:two-component system chemotaxis response regulator CheY